MLNVILITTEKITIEYTKKEVRKELKHFAIIIN